MNKTVLHGAHTDLRARMGAFAGYDMPLYYEAGVLKEHEWVRTKAGLFDVSHMVQIMLEGPNATAFWEHVTPSVFANLTTGQARYSVLTTPQGGIQDDVIITRVGAESYYAVLNAGRGVQDLVWLRAQAQAYGGVTITDLSDRALIALQGPQAQSVLRDVCGWDLEAQPYMSMRNIALPDAPGAAAYLSRLGYTGEDGFEISIPAAQAVALWTALLAHEDVLPIGLAARDSLRLEMGYCLYGHDIDDTTSPVEAGLGWLVRKTPADFIGAAAVRAHAQDGVTRKRVGVVLQERGMIREGAAILAPSGEAIGNLTSGGFSPTLKTAIGQGYVTLPYAQAGQAVLIDVRGRSLPAIITPMPFVPPRTRTQSKTP